MRRILLKEDAIEKIREATSVKLPDFIYDALKTNNTSLGDCAAFPPNDEYGFAYSLIKNRFNEVLERIEKYGYETLDEDFLITRLNKLINDVSKTEKPNRDALQTLCYNVVNETLGTPQDTIILDCVLTNRITPKSQIRILPENMLDNADYDFEDVNDINMSNDAVAKRRVVDALIQGISYSLMIKTIKEHKEEICKIMPHEILKAYQEINDIDNYLLFIKKEKISDFNPSQTSYVEVRLGHGREKTTISSQGLILPYLLKETFRGFLELFSSHGLPKDNHKAMYVIKKADFALAEPWDLRFGVPMWQRILNNCNDFSYGYIPYMFSDICKMGSDDFNNIVANLLANTKKGKQYINAEIYQIKNDVEYQEFINNIQRKNNNPILTDEYMSEDDLDNVIVEDGD